MWSLCDADGPGAVLVGRDGDAVRASCGRHVFGAARVRWLEEALVELLPSRDWRGRERERGRVVVAVKGSACEVGEAEDGPELGLVVLCGGGRRAEDAGHRLGAGKSGKRVAIRTRRGVQVARAWPAGGLLWLRSPATRLQARNDNPTTSFPRVVRRRRSKGRRVQAAPVSNAVQAATGW